METAVRPLVDRRAFARIDGREDGTVAARVRPGRPAAVVDLSPAGAAIEVPFRLLPGASVDLQIDSAGCRTDVKGRVVRCSVVRVEPDAVSYLAAIAFERACAPFSGPRGHGYDIPAKEIGPRRLEWVGATRTVV